MLLSTLLLALVAAPTTTDVTAALFEKYECHRCHEGTGLAPLPVERHCVQCHREIGAGRYPARPSALKRWQAHLVSLPAAPSLTASRRLRRSWIERYLLEPHDVRPALAGTMPRLPITAEDARTLADHLGAQPQDGGTLDPAEAEAGRALYRKLGCSTCHRFQGSGETGAADAIESAPGFIPADAILLAPDLAHTRRRIAPPELIAWLRNPRAFDPHTQMPAQALGDRELRQLAAFVMHAPLQIPQSKKLPLRLPLLKRKVGWEEVSRRVFRRVCWHCHSDPEYANGDGGPGNTGGFGYAARGLDLSSYEGLGKGTLGPDGKRHSVFIPGPDGTPRLVAALLARSEELRGEVGAITGMPLGLPPLPPEDLQLIESWIDQGRPR